MARIIAGHRNLIKLPVELVLGGRILYRVGDGWYMVLFRKIVHFSFLTLASPSQMVKTPWVLRKKIPSGTKHPSNFFPPGNENFRPQKKRWEVETSILII